jgi:sugar/nucleoside kinase (ribokinase family)
MPEKSGIAAFGNWIVDKIRMVDRGKPHADTPSDIPIFSIVNEGQLTHINRVYEGTGGAPYNVLIDLAKLNAGLPLGAVGIVGDDADGRFILEDLERNQIASSGMLVFKGARTSFTDVYQPDGGNRGFAHFSADTNDKLSVEHIKEKLDFIGKYRICHGGYALLLATLDAPDGEYGTKMARALKMIKDKGVKTSLAVVSDRDAARFQKVVTPSLKYTDFFMPNEYEATNITGIGVRDRTTARDAAKKLFDEYGVGEVVVIHMGEAGSFGMLRDGRGHYQPVHKIDKIEGTAGSGDAFEAGMLYALYNNKTLEYGMRLGTAMAAICLGGSTCTDSMMDLTFTEEFMNRTPYRS